MVTAQQLIDSTPTAIIDVYGRRKALTKMFYKKLPPFEDSDKAEKVFQEWNEQKEELKKERW